MSSLSPMLALYPGSMLADGLAGLTREELAVAALDGLPRALLVVDAAQRVRLVSRVAASLLRLSDMPLEGAPLATVLAAAALDPADNAALLAACAAVFEGSPPATALALGGVQHALICWPLVGGAYVLLLDPIPQPHIPPEMRQDPLTGLADQRWFQEALGAALDAAPHAPQFAVLAIDLDRFKSVNDTLGHAVGDAVLRTAAGRLGAALRESDLAARLGGDEFAVIAHLDDTAAASRLAGRIVDLLSRPCLVQGHVVVRSASVGVTMAGPGDDPPALLRRADLALYEAKATGRNTFRFFESRLEQRAEARRLLEFDLRRAVALDEFELYFQPQVELSRRRLTGFEALIRWHHPVRGLVSPGEFMPLAEELDLATPIGEWVLHAACRAAATWPAPLSVAVNVAAPQIEDGRLVATVASALQASGLPGRRLEIEVTETALLRRSETVLATLRELQAMDVRIAMDDFGTGYSSLTQLQSFPFDKIKIDRSFVSCLHTPGEGAAIVRAIAGLGTSLGMRTIAEGVETEAQLESVRIEGCNEVQGFLFGRPVPGEAIPAIIWEYGQSAEAPLLAGAAVGEGKSS